LKTAKKRVLILGGGFGGVYAAMRLEKLLAAMLARQEVEICLVSRDNFFLFTPMLHEIAASDLKFQHRKSAAQAPSRRGHRGRRGPN
jgi:NADH dehydrogenase